MRLTLPRSLVIVFALPIFLRAPLLLGFLLADPFYRFANLGGSSAGPLAGMPSIDPNIGFVDQALTGRALDALFHGSLPWWNPFEGFGVPLAGEMQDSALYPLSLLIALPNGSLYMSIVLAIFAGLGMLLLLRKLGLGAWPALAGALTFEMCGTFSWLSGAWSYSIPWLPFAVFGIELCRSRQRFEHYRGIAIVAASTALLIYAGFIETSYLEGLVVVAWSVARLFSPGNLASRAFVLRAAAGGIAGIAIGAPILVAFVDTLSISYVGIHDASNAGAVLEHPAILQHLVPYAFGPIFASAQQPVADVWGSTGGYVGFALFVLALAGIFARAERIPRVVCALTLVFGFTAMFGGPLLPLFLAIPGVKFTAYYRYIDPAVAFAASLLAAYALEDVRAGAGAALRVLGALAAGLCIAAWAFSLSATLLTGSGDGDLVHWRTFSLVAFVLTTVWIVLSLVPRSGSLRSTALGLLLCLEAALFLVIPILSNPAGATTTLGGVQYLRDRIGYERAYTFGPIGPNYGSYVGVPVINYADVPTPQRAVDYIHERLDDQADPINFLAGRPRTGTITLEQNFASKLDAFEDAGVKYVLVEPNAPAPAPHLVPRYRDSAMQIFELPNPKPYFSATGCRLAIASRTSLTASCRAPSTLCRLELNLPGWTADVDGKRVEPARCGEIFQAIDLPAGSSTIAYAFLPPHMRVAEAVFAIGMLALVALIAIAAAARPRRRAMTLSA